MGSGNERPRSCVDRRTTLGLLAAGALAPVPEPAFAAAGDGAAVVILQALLRLNILPFWRRICDQPSVEGYELNVDDAGVPQGPSNRLIVPQTRTTYFFSHLARSRWAGPRDLAIAAHGFDYLTRRMWDPAYGGFFWQVAHTTHAPLRTDKQLNGQAHALLALSEYALASGSSDARRWADDAAAAVEARLRDPATGDYREYRLQDWSPWRAGDPFPPGGFAPEVRVFGSRSRLLDALTSYHELKRGRDGSGELLENAVRIVEGSILEIEPATYYTRETDPLVPAPRELYLVDMQAAHHLRRARAALGLGPGTEPPSYRGLIDSALRWGEDTAAGGFFEQGVPGQPANVRYKVGFTQAEALLGLCDSLVRTGNAAHRAAFWRTLLWIARRQADWARGDWYYALGDGAPTGAKGSPFHTGRSVLRSLELLGAPGRGGG